MSANSTVMELFIMAESMERHLRSCEVRLRAGPAQLTLLSQTSHKLRRTLLESQLTPLIITFEVVIDLIHFHNNIIGDSSLSQQDIQLTRHPASHGVDSKSDKEKN